MSFGHITRPAALPAGERTPVAYATTNEEGDYAMLFFDEQEARLHSGDDEPIPLGVIAAPPASEQKPVAFEAREIGEVVMQTVRRGNKQRNDEIDALKEKLRVAREAVTVATLELKELKQSIGFRHQTLIVIENCENALAAIGDE